MSVTRTFRQARTPGVLVPITINEGVAHRVMAGEACTEIGCEAERTAPLSWLQRWFGSGRKAGSPSE